MAVLPEAHGLKFIKRSGSFDAKAAQCLVDGKL